MAVNPKAKYVITADDETSAAWKSATSRAERGAAALKKTIAGAFAGASAAALVGGIIRATAEAEEAMANLRNAVERNGGAAQRSAPQLAEMASELQRLTTYSDEAIMDMQGLLLRFKEIGGGTFDRAQRAVLDVSAALRKDLSSSAQLVGRALADPEKGMTRLERAGVQFSSQSKDTVEALLRVGDTAGAQAIILKELEARYGGAAEAARENFNGALIALKNVAGDLLEAKDGLPGVTAEINALTDALADPETKEAIDTLLSLLIKGLGNVGETLKVIADSIAWLNENAGRSPLVQFVMGLGVELGLVGDEIEEINDQIAFLEEQRKSFLPFVLTVGTTFDPEGGVGVLTPEEIDKRIAELRDQQRKLMDAAGGTKRPPAGASTGDGAAGFALKEEGFRLPDFEIPDLPIDTAKEMQELKELLPIEEWREQVQEMAEIREGLFEVLDDGIEEGVEGSANRAQEAIEELGAQMGEVLVESQEMSEFAEEAARSMQRHFADFLFDPFKDGLKGMAKGFIDTIRRMLADAAAAKLLEMLFGKGPGKSSGKGGFASFLGGLFGGFLADGGPLQQGKWHIAGEKGPEPIWGGGPGAFAAGYPTMSAARGNVTFSPVFNIDARGSTRDSVAMLGPVVAQAASLAKGMLLEERRRGKF